MVRITFNPEGVQHYVIKLVSALQQVSGFLQVLRKNKNIFEIVIKYVYGTTSGLNVCLFDGV
jgi:hypothetical protein